MSGRGDGRLSPGLMAGWLFADVLLMLVVVVLGGQPVTSAAPGPTASPSGAPSSAAPSSATPTPSPTPSPAPSRTSARGLDPDSKSVTVTDVDVAGVLNGTPRALAQVREGVLGQLDRYAGRRAAMVFVWGTAADCAGCAVQEQRSSRLAKQVAPGVHDWAPTFFPEQNPQLIRPYFDGGGTPNSVRLELFFLTD
ncbi:hypothetical protein ACIRBX_01095 [Kitasatospora sp. NPDC096147]|uniref:hypothetical protein n=1 Tax=Kitasatospora sp. NPDC096147 TaxID=3364093 RepID=UPI00382DEE97